MIASVLKVILVREGIAIIVAVEDLPCSCFFILGKPNFGRLMGRSIATFGCTDISILYSSQEWEWNATSLSLDVSIEQGCHVQLWVGIVQPEP